MEQAHSAHVVQLQDALHRKRDAEYLRLINLDEVRRLTGLGTSAIYARMREQAGQDGFPRAVLRGSRHVAWKLGEVLDWIESRPVADRKIAA